MRKIVGNYFLRFKRYTSHVYFQLFLKAGYLVHAFVFAKSLAGNFKKILLDGAERYSLF